MKISTSLLERILARWPTGTLSTYGLQHIASVPIVFLYRDGVIYSPIDGKPKSGQPLARLANLERNPGYSLLLQNYTEDWSNLWWLRLSGQGVVIPASSLEPSALQKLKAGLQAKYPQYENANVPLLNNPDTDTVLRLELDNTNAWAFEGKSTFGTQFPELD